MVQTGKLAVISILAVLGLGALGGGFYVGNTYIPDALDEGIKDSLVVDENYATDDPEGYADWLTNEDDDDPPKYKRYYLWNLTNPDDYLTGSTPIYEELGPYVYQQFDIKINVELTSTTKKYQTYTYYEFDAAQSTGSETDKIVNINPAYLGVVAGAGSEMNLRFSFTETTVATVLAGLQGDFTSAVLAQGPGTALASVMGGLTTAFPISVASGALEQMIEGYRASFVPQVQIQAVATALNTVQSEVTNNFHLVVNGSTAANVLNATIGGVADVVGNSTAWNGFFNTTSFSTNYGTGPVIGLGEYNTTSTEITATSAELLLYNGSLALGVDGWLADLSQGLGILGYLQAYGKALVNDGLTLAIMAGAYGLTVSQLHLTVDYLTNFIIQNIVPGAFQAANGGLTPAQAAPLMFYAQWANMTHVPTGISIDDDLTPDGVEAAIIAGPTGINLTTVMKLFDSTNGTSLTNDTGVFVWDGAVNGNATLEGLLTLNYGLNSTQQASVFAWFEIFKEGIAEGGLLATFAPEGVTEIKDLAYLQWGNSSITTPYSLFEIDDTSSTNYTEFWAWSNRVDGSDLEFNATFAEDLLNGTNGLFNATKLGTFLVLFADGITADFGTIEALWGLSISEAIALAGYISYVFSELIIAPLVPLGVTSISDLGYLQWASSALVGASIFDIDPSSAPNYPEFWAWADKVSGSADLGESFTVAETKALFTGVTNFTDGANTLAFLTLMSTATAENLTTVQNTWGLSATKAASFAGYLNYLIEEFVKPTLLFDYSSSGYTGVEDIGYLQFASSDLTGESLFVLNAPLPGYPEPWAYYDRVLSIDYSMNVTNSRALLSGDYNLANATGIGTFLALAQGADSTDPVISATSVGTINFLFESKLNKTDVLMIAGWLDHIMTTFVDGFLLQPQFDLGGGLIATKTVEEWLWDYEDPLLLFLKENGVVDDAHWSFFPPHTGKDDPNISAASTYLTGADDVNNVMTYVLWQGIPGLPDRDDDPVNGVWDHVELVEGTDATQFHPGVEDTEVLRAWVSELARTVDITFLEDTETEGIDLLRFILSDETLAVNSAFDQEVKGVANMTYSQGVPLFVSKPHFLDAEAAAGTVTGLAPVRADHETFIDVEPTTGAVMNAAKRLQISFQISAGNFYTSEIVGTHFMPVVWVEEGGAITPELAEDFKNAIYGAQQIADVAPIAGGAIGAVLLLTSMFIGIRARKP